MSHQRGVSARIDTDEKIQRSSEEIVSSEAATEQMLLLQNEAERPSQISSDGGLGLVQCG